MPAKNIMAKSWSILPSYDGKLYSRYPLGDRPVTPADVPSNPVTVALNATGSGTRYDVGPGKAHTTTDTVPWGSLGPGDVVNIFYQATPYQKFGLRAQGTLANPVIINGVTDASGNRPIISGTTRTAAGSNPGAPNNVFSATPAFGEGLGAIVVKRGPSDAFGTYAPKHIHFKNLEVANALSGNTYQDLTGATQTFGSAGGVYFLLLEDGLVENCVIHDNAFGVFTQAKDGAFSEACKRITFRNNRVYNNGVSGSFFEHNFYVQCHLPIIEGNYIGQVRSGSLGSSYKSRSSGEVFRYNYVEASARACDWVHSEDQGTDGIVTKPEYGTDYVYGNVFVNDFNLPRGGANGALHFGGDNLGEEDGTSVGGANVNLPTYRDRLYFWNNTVVMRATSAQSFRAYVFALSLVPTQVDAWNNIFVLDGSCRWSWVAYAGQVNLRGNNIVYGTMNAAHDAATNTAKYTITEVDPINTSNPLLVDLVGRDYHLQAASPAKDLSSTPAGMSTVSDAHLVQYSPRLAANGLIGRESVSQDLGALELV